MLRVFIVDDSVKVRNQLKKFFRLEGHQVVGEAENGHEAFVMYPRLKPDLTTLDLMMPYMNGLESLEKIKEIDPHAKIIMISSAGTDGNIQKAKSLGVIDFLVKPIQETELKKHILDLVEKIKKGKVA